MSRRRASSRSIRAWWRRSTSSSSSIFSVSARRSCSSWVRRSASGEVCPSTRSMSASRPSRSCSSVRIRAATSCRPSSSRSRSRSDDERLRRSASISARRPAASSPIRRRTSSISRRCSSAARNSCSARSSSCSPASSSVMTRASSCSARVELAVDPVQPRGPRGLGSQVLACGRLSVHRRPERLIGVGASGLGRAERLLGVGERAGGGGAVVGPLQHLSIEAVEQLPGGLARFQPLVPPVLAPVLLTHQRPQTSGRQLARELLGLLGERLVLLGHLGLLLQRFQLPAELRQHVLQAQEILVEPRELALRAFLPAAMLRDAGGLLDVLATLLRTREQDLFQLALTDHGVERAADPRLGQELLDVEQPHDLAVDPVLALAAAEDRAADLDLGHRHGDLARRVVDDQLHLGHTEGRTRRGSGEDDVGHVPAAEGARALLSERPADRIHQVRLARPVGTDDHADARDELQDGLVRERLEAADLDLTQEHSARC